MENETKNTNGPEKPLTQATGYATADDLLDMLEIVMQSGSFMRDAWQGWRTYRITIDCGAYGRVDTDTTPSMRCALAEAKRQWDEIVALTKSHNNESSVTPHEERKETK